MRLISRYMEGSVGLLLADELAKLSFTEEEYLSPIEAMKMEGMKVFLIYDEEDNFNGFIIIKIHKNIVYLFFIAVEPKYRNKKIGTEAIKQLIDLYKDYIIVVDIELPELSKDDYQKRLKRKNFYTKNGFFETKKALTYYDEIYEILSNKRYFDFQIFQELMEDIKTDKNNFNMKFIDL